MPPEDLVERCLWQTAAWRPVDSHLYHSYHPSRLGEVIITTACLTSGVYARSGVLRIDAIALLPQFSTFRSSVRLEEGVTAISQWHARFWRKQFDGLSSCHFTSRQGYQVKDTYRAWIWTQSLGGISHVSSLIRSTNRSQTIHDSAPLSYYPSASRHNHDSQRQAEARSPRLWAAARRMVSRLQAQPPTPTRAQTLPRTIINEAAAASPKQPIVNMGQGFFGYNPPKFILDAAKAALDRVECNQYSPTKGRPRLKKAIADAYSPFWGREINPETEVTITTGANEGMLSAFMAFIEPGDEVIIFEPFFDQ